MRKNRITSSAREPLWFEPRLRVGGRWLTCSETFSVADPATGDRITSVPRASAKEAEQAVEAAHLAFGSWRFETSETRSRYLLRIHDLMLEHSEPLALIKTAEQGAPLEQARNEVEYAAGFFRWFAEEARRIYGRSVPHKDPRRRLRVEYCPVGVVGAITPWNAPLANPAKKVAASVAAGCTIVVKPAELAPLSMLALAWLADKAGLPAGVLNVVCGDAPAIGKVFLRHDHVRMISFTGSVAVGKYLMSEAGKYVKKVSLELGGNAPFLVFGDTDLDECIKDLVWLKSLNSGQVCVTANRILVERTVHEDFISRLQESLSRERVGDGRSPETTIGPLIHQEAVAKVEQLVREAVSSGARVVWQMEPIGKGNGSFYPPVVLDRVTPEMRIAQDEIFGPVFSVLNFDTDEEALALANDTPYGLSAYVYTSNMRRAFHFSERLEAGVVGVNDPRPIIPEAPFGGVKMSGIGREGGTEGLFEYLDAKLIGFRY